MKHLFYSGMIGCLSALLVGCSAQPQSEVVQNADIEGIRQAEQEFVSANLAGDIDGVLALRTEDIVWLPPGHPAVEGKMAVRRFLQADPARPIEFTAMPEHTEGRGDLAYNRGTWSGTFVVGADTIRDHGKYVQIWRRENGEWRIALDIFNSDLPVVP